MATTVGELVVNVKANTTSFDTGVSNTKTSLTKLSSSAKTFGTNMTKFATLPILALGTAMVKTAIDVEKQKTAFGVLLKDVEKGNTLYTELQQLASKTPLQIEAITSTAERLLASGTALNEVNDVITNLGDIALGDAAKLDTLTNAYSKMSAKGKASMEELNMITEAGVPILQALADGYGSTVEEVYALSSAGKITFTDVQTALEGLTSETGQFHDGMEKLSETTGGKLSTAIDNFNLAASEFGVQMLPMINDIIDGATDLFKKFGDLDEGTKKTILTVAAFAAGMGPVILMAGKATTAVKGLSTALKFLGANPLILVAGAAIAGALAINDLVNSSEELEAVNARLEANQKKRAEGTWSIYDDLSEAERAFARLLEDRGSYEDKASNDRINQLISEQALLIYNIKEKIKAEGQAAQAKIDAIQAEADAEAELLAELIEAEQQKKEAKQKVLDSYDEQYSQIQMIIEANDLETKTRIELIDEEIAQINELQWADGEQKEAQLEATKILQAEKQTILDEEKQAEIDKIDAIELAKIDADIAETLRLEKKALDKKEQFEADVAQYEDYAGTLLGIMDNLYTVQLNNIESESNAKIAALDEDLLGEDAYATAVEKIEYDAALASWKIEKEQLRVSKANSLIEIAINTAIGVSKALAQGGLFGIATGALVAVAGVAQASAVLSQADPEKPQLATGAMIAGSQRGVDVTVGESGNDELILGGGSQGEALLGRFADKISDRMGGGSSVNNYYFQSMVATGDDASMRKFSRVIRPFTVAEEQRIGARA